MIAQIDSAGVAQLAPYLTGPGAAVLVLMAVLGGLYALVVRHLVPLVTTLGKRHLEQIDALLAQQAVEGRQFAKALSAIERSLACVDRRLSRLEGATDASGPGSITNNPAGV